MVESSAPIPSTCARSIVQVYSPARLGEYGSDCGGHTYRECLLLATA